LSKKKILIAGGTGFIGYHLAKKCLAFGWSVTSISTKKPKNYRKLKNVHYKICDISNMSELKKNIKLRYDYVVNLAGYVDHSHKKKVIQSHYVGCKNLATLFIDKNIVKFIQVGSSTEYGRLKSPQNENFIIKKTYSFYGRAKFLSTRFLLKLKKQFGFPVTILRFYLLYGPYQDENRVIPITIKNALRNNSFNCSSGNQFRDFLYIDDAVKAIILALKSKKTDGQIINIGSGKPIKIKNVILKICKLVGNGKPIFGKIKLRNDEIMKLYPNILKSKKMINWNYKVPLNMGLKKTIDFFKYNEQKN
jgi:nucleoside-diphosphate-sugar epimerase